MWHRTRIARDLVRSLGPGDVRLVLRRPIPGPDHFAWVADGAHGSATIAALDRLREASVGPAFTRARDAAARRAALQAAARVPSVQRVLAVRFGDPARWHGLDPADATRRFRASWQPPTRTADHPPQSARHTPAPPP